MGTFWAEFVITGDPNGSGNGSSSSDGSAPTWPLYGRAGQFLQLDVPSAGGVRAVSGTPAGCGFMQAWVDRATRGAA